MAEEIKKETNEEEKKVNELPQEDLEKVAGGQKPSRLIRGKPADQD